MNKKILFFLLILFFNIVTVNAACVENLSGVKGMTYRTNGHQNQWLQGMGSYTSQGGAVSSSCISISSSSIVKVKVSGTTFYFSPQAHGNADINISVSAGCTCSGTAISKSVHFKLSEWGLGGLEVKGYSLSPTFYNGTYNYTIHVPSNVNSVDVTAKPNEAAAKVEITGDKDIAANGNKISIKVTTIEGDARTYTISVVKDGSESPSVNSETKPSSSSKNVTPNTNNDSDNDNPETGMLSMYTFWGICILAIGYAIYYYKGYSQINN